MCTREESEYRQLLKKKVKGIKIIDKESLIDLALFFGAMALAYLFAIVWQIPLIPAS